MIPFATSRRVEWIRNVIRITRKMKLKRRGADIRTPLNIFVRERGLLGYSVSTHPTILPKAILVIPMIKPPRALMNTS